MEYDDTVHYVQGGKSVVFDLTGQRDLIEMVENAMNPETPELDFTVSGKYRPK